HAAFRAGLVVCPLSPLYKQNELSYALKKANVKALLLPGCESKQSSINDFHGVFQKSELDEIKKNLKHLILIDGNNSIPNFQGFEVHFFDKLLENDGNLSEEAKNSVTSDDPAALFFTSGTTGKPKGALISHYHMSNNMKFALAKGLSLNGPVSVPLPLFHAFAGIGASVYPIKHYRPIVLNNFWFNIKSTVESIVKYNCVEFWGVPTMVFNLCEYIEATNTKIDSLQKILMGGSPVYESLIKKVKRLIPSIKELSIAYGSTEFGSFVTQTGINDSEEIALKTVGQVADHVSLKIVDPITKKIVKIGEQGEIWVKGYCRMLGYYEDEEKTREVIDQSGWYNMGDLGVLDENGYLKIIGRTKEMIIRGGINLFPKEIEDVINTHPNVAEAYVCGVPSEKLGEEVCAW
ncbi:AMP-binding protein-like protein, partial [Dinothrombium tinctorium]